MPALLIFALDDTRFALPVDQVRETVRVVEITPLAGAPGVVEGVIDVRGTLTPVLDLRARFALPARPVRLTDHLVLATAGARPVALRVDRVHDVQQVAEHEVTPAPPSEPALRHLAGVAHLSDGLVLIHDLAAFLGEGEEEALRHAMESESASGAAR